MMTKVLIYGFCVGVRSSRRISRAMVEDVAIDTTKVKANASKHKAMSYGRMKAEEERLARMVGEMMGEADRLDREEDERFGKDRREAKRALEEKAREAGKEEPAAKAQRNFTDPDAGIMVNGERAFVQGYNCQAEVPSGPPGTRRI